MGRVWFGLVWYGVISCSIAYFSWLVVKIVVKREVSRDSRRQGMIELINRGGDYYEERYV